MLRGTEEEAIQEVRALSRKNLEEVINKNTNLQSEIDHLKSELSLCKESKKKVDLELAAQIENSKCQNSKAPISKDDQAFEQQSIKILSLSSRLNELIYENELLKKKNQNSHSQRASEYVNQQETHQAVELRSAYRH